MASSAVSQLLPQSENSFATPVGPTALAHPFYNGRGAYIRALQDKVIPPAGQTGMLAGSGVEWDIRDFETGHSPFAAVPEKFVGTLVELAEGWIGKDE